jgi:pimeloyl-ACP methyl ester carboxylesterase
MLTERRMVTLADGGSIGILEWGSPRGAPIIYLHGTPSSAVEAYWLHLAAERHGVKIFAVDRPGYGASSPAAEGFDVTGQICSEVADQLGLAHFGVAAFSGGAGYALAVASVCHDRVTRVQIGGGMGSIAGVTPAGFPRSRKVQMNAIVRSGPLFRLLVKRMPGKRRQVLEERLAVPMYAGLEMLVGAAAGGQLPAVEEFVRTTPTQDLRDFVEAYARAAGDTTAIMGDFRAIVRPWPFDLDGVHAPVDLWHGTADQAVPIGIARELANRLPDARLHELEGEGHFVFVSHANDVCARFA